MSIKMLKLYECGYCTHPEKIVNPDKGFKSIEFPAIVGLLEHSTHGYILFDTGYASHFLEATKRFPYSVYAKLTPVYFSEEKSIKNQLLKDGISPDEISIIFLSHFHGDHTAGLKDFPKAQVYTFETAYENIRHNSKFKALSKGCLLDLLPVDLDERLTFIDCLTPIDLDESFGEFEKGYAVFGDDSLVAVDLTGHAVGQFGIFIKLMSGKRVFLCADAVWVSEAFEQLIYPLKIANLLIADKKQYVSHIQKLHHLSKAQPEIDILPTHCSITWEKAKRGFIYE
ncbi:MBL fold metallo-hydrolase [Bacillus sp. DTU_2020_1000418_1_SI_GHA_SEK_038]|uniref:MBL fold metallo-hydrolase n=1 Tax=Bacillus sp. DTU_2020_1000418_1_SI_GHA_SEK_038 TaxID=3077585 RepID=UPI0028E9B7C0|nr:MBL fold metallo-hydrolase [Bacillus sp. DTU_2020_1000418_1_SI_GHA_SEK_038]WNS75028.1 MBL fold metallo-hydrolase [Bacillus sp. DTU_2020_1000418_1_SI_GHA_SEK_038]